MPGTGQQVTGDLADGTPIVVRLRERPAGAVVRTIPVGPDRAAAEALADRIADDLAHLDADAFVASYGIGAEPTAPVRRSYLGLGSNLGDRDALLQRAVDGLAATDRITVVAVSPVYETEPVGGPDQPEYLNAVVGIETDLTPRQLLEVAHRLEQDAGRVRDGEAVGPPHPRRRRAARGRGARRRARPGRAPSPAVRAGFRHGPPADLDAVLAPRVPPGEAGVRRSEVVLALPETQ